MMDVKHLRTGFISATALALISAAPAYAQNNDSQNTHAKASQSQDMSKKKGTSQDQATRSQDDASTNNRQQSTARADGDADDGYDAQNAYNGESGSDAQSGDEQMNQAVMLDIDSFSQELYERGYRQGYIRGIADAREQVMRQMARINNQRRQYNRQSQRSENEGRRQADDTRRQQASRYDNSGSQRQSDDMKRGAVVILPPGMSPQAFLRRLQENTEQTAQKTDKSSDSNKRQTSTQ